MRTFLLIAFCLLLTACGAAPAATGFPQGLPYVVTITDTAEPAPLEPLLATPLADRTETPPPASATPVPSATATVPTPTETRLPLLELPTERANAPARVTWTGEPTYPGDSEAGRLFRVDYDPDIWAQTESDTGEIVLAHRQIDYCTITAYAGRGLPQGWKVEHEFRSIGDLFYDVNTVLSLGEVKFVAYVGGDKRILTGFQVSFKDQKAQCLEAAEAIFATLRSFSAQPTVTPTFTPDLTLVPEMLAPAGSAGVVTSTP